MSRRNKIRDLRSKWKNFWDIREHGSAYFEHIVNAYANTFRVDPADVKTPEHYKLYLNQSLLNDLKVDKGAFTAHPLSFTLSTAHAGYSKRKLQ